MKTIRDIINKIEDIETAIDTLEMGDSLDRNVICGHLYDYLTMLKNIKVEV